MLKLKKLYSVTLCFALHGAGRTTYRTGTSGRCSGGVDLNSEGYLYNVPDLQPGALGFTNVALTHLGVNIGQLVGHYADGVVISNALDLLPYVGQSLEVTDINGRTMISISETGIYLYDDVLEEFVPITVTNGNLFFNGNVVGGQGTASALTLIDESGGESEVLVTVDGGTLNVDGSPVNTDDQTLSISNTVLKLEDGGEINLDDNLATDTDLTTVSNTLSSSLGSLSESVTVVENSIEALGDTKLISWSDRFVGFAGYIGSAISQGFEVIDTNGQSELITVAGRQVHYINDNDSGVSQLILPLDYEDARDIHERGGVFVIDYELATTTGVNGGFIGFQLTRDFLEATLLSDGGTLADALPASADVRGKRYDLFTASVGGNLSVATYTTFNAPGYTDVQVAYDTRVRIEVVIEDGLDNPATVYVTPMEGAYSDVRLLAGTVNFNNNEGGAPDEGEGNIIVSSGSSSGTLRRAYVTEFGLNIYGPENTTYTLTTSDMSLDRIRLITPERRADFELVFPVHTAETTYNHNLSLEITVNNIGSLTLRNADENAASFFEKLNVDPYVIVNDSDSTMMVAAQNQAAERLNFDFDAATVDGAEIVDGTISTNQLSSEVLSTITDANTDNQTLSLTDTTLSIEDGGAGINLDDNFATDSELSSVSNAVAGSVTMLQTTIISGGTTNSAVTLADGDGDGADTLTTTNGVLYLNGVAVDTDTTIANTDDQTLSLTDTTLSIEDGGAGIDLGATFATDDELSAVSNTLSTAIADASANDPSSTDNVEFYYDFSESLEVNNERNGGQLTGIGNLTLSTNDTLGVGYAYVAAENDKLSRTITSTDTFTFYWSGFFEDEGDHTLFDNRSGTHIRFVRRNNQRLDVWLNSTTTFIFSQAGVLIPVEVNTPYFITLRVRPNGANTDYTITVNGVEYTALDNGNTFDALGGTLYMNELQTGAWAGDGFISEVGLSSEWLSINEIARLEDLYRAEEDPYDPPQWSTPITRCSHSVAPP